ncbi:MAG: hypothetical protein DGJ47_000966 [Rickettsiaceae bacterium]
MLDTLFTKLKPILNSPVIIFVYSILSKWYIMVMLTALMVTFWVFKGLTDTGILQAAEKTVSAALKDTKSVARYCVPKILSFSDFWECLQNPPEYEESENELELQKNLNNLLNPKGQQQNADPSENQQMTNPYAQ